nr:reverse transcriptase domain-containing protein [Tanacetum cinerariifolium]
MINSQLQPRWGFDPGKLLYYAPEDPPVDPPEVSMADNRTMAELLQAPTEVLPSFKNDKSSLRDHEIYEAWDRFNDLLRACPHHRFFELHQLDTFYNAVNINDQDSLNSAAGGNFLDKMPREYLKIIENKSKVHQSRAKSVVAKVSTSSSTPSVSSEVFELKDMVRALLLDKKNQSSAPTQSSTPAPVKAIEPNCVTCGGAHSYQNFLATNENAYRDNIQERHDQANEQIEKFYEIFKEINFMDAFILMPKFTFTLKALIRNKKKLSEMARTLMNEHCSVVILKRLPRKLRDPGKFLIPCQFPGMDEYLALADLDASINLMPLFMWEGLSLSELTPTCIILELADRLVSKPIGIAKDVSVKVGVFYFLANFMVIDFEPDPRVPLILERCFLKTVRALIDVHKGELTLCIRNEAITYNLDQTVRYSANYNQMTVNKIHVICEMYSQEVLSFFDVTASGNPTPYDDPINLTTYPTLTPFGDSDFLLFEEADAFLGLEDDPNSQEFNPFYYDPEGDILLLEAILNSEPYFQIPIDPRDQEKTTFTCPYGTFAYRRMPFGLCNAPGTFQRCMLAIFHDMVEKTMKVFMDDFLVFGNSFENCLSRLDKMLQRIEVDRAKVNVIAKLPHPTTVKDCIKAFHTLKNKLTEAPILIAPNWDRPFKLMCDASDFAIGAVLGQRHEKHFKPIHYASKMMNDAESNYTTTEKEMLAVVYAFEKFQSYLIMNKSIVHTDHFALKYLFAKKDTKARLLRWVLLLQEFDFKVLDTKGAENLAADHLSRLENPYENVLDPKEINETFPLETLSMVTFRGDSSAPWFADFANYHVGNLIVKGMTS